MKIRYATQADLAQLCDLSDEINRQHTRHLPADFRLPQSRLQNEAFWQNALNDQESVVFVAESEQQILGLITVKCAVNTTSPFLVPRKKCHIGTIVVTASRQRNGVGKALMERVDSYARENHCEAIQLEVMDFNQEAQAFYRALGYEDFSRKMTRIIR